MIKYQFLLLLCFSCSEETSEPIENNISCAKFQIEICENIYMECKNNCKADLICKQECGTEALKCLFSALTDCGIDSSYQNCGSISYE